MLIQIGLVRLINKINILIPAAGKGSRSKLDYPKTLFKINNKSILERIIRNTSFLNSNVSIIASPHGKKVIFDFLKKKKIKSEILIQKKPHGMGDAILHFKESKFFKNTNDILLIWGDVPYIKKSTFKKLINFHYNNQNTLSMLSIFVNNPYTLIKRNKFNKIKEVIETKNLKKKYKYGEREIGAFVVNKKIIFKFLNKKYMTINKNKEHGFLYLVKILVKNNYKVESLLIDDVKESKSLNYINDIK